jgi:hypothetical protein
MPEPRWMVSLMTFRLGGLGPVGRAVAQQRRIPDDVEDVVEVVRDAVASTPRLHLSLQELHLELSRSPIPCTSSVVRSAIAPRLCAE